MPETPALVTPLSQFKAVCENATAALFVMDERQHCVYMNGAAELLTGYSLAEVQGRPLHDFIHHTRPDGRPYPLHECPIDRAAPHDNQEQGEEVFVHKDGHFYSVAFTASPIRQERGVVGTVIEVRCIDDQKRREREAQALRALSQCMLAEVELEAIVQAATDVATELTGARFGAFFYNVIDAGGARYTLYTLSGVPREAFSSFPMPRATRLFAPTFNGEATIRIADVLADPRYGHSAPHHGMPPGHLPVRSYLATPVAADSGEILGGLFFGHPEPGVFDAQHEALVESIAAQAAVGVSRARLFAEARAARERAEAEARENERLYRAARQANEMKDLFLATVSHELRTPLTSILGWSEMLASGRLPAERSAEGIGIIARNARAQAQIVEDLLDISRIASGKLELQMAALDPRAPVEAAANAVRHTAIARDIALELRLDAEVPQVEGDAERLQQVVWNLLANALKFTDPGGRVEVVLRGADDHVEIAVDDSGCGIEQDFLPYLFDRFSQHDSSTTRRHGGLGLGLALVRQLVEMHGGSVAATSAGPGQGASFVVRLPALRARPSSGPGATAAVDAAARGEPLPYAAPDLQGCRVLLVDDEPDTRAMLAILLGTRGAEVRTCASTREALQAEREFTPHVIVSDIGMPGEDGYRFISELRARERAEGRSSVPAVALTAYARAEDRMRALEQGFQMHAAKPVHPDELLALVDTLRSWPDAAGTHPAPFPIPSP
jgi:PAS domain S-box-containing protein